MKKLIVVFYIRQNRKQQKQSAFQTWYTSKVFDLSLIVERLIEYTYNWYNQIPYIGVVI